MIFKKPSFKMWLGGYEDEFQDELLRWMQQTRAKTKKGQSVVLPEGFEEYFLAQYVAYNSEIKTRELIFVTWALVAVNIILVIISFIIK